MDLAGGRKGGSHGKIKNTLDKGIYTLKRPKAGRLPCLGTSKETSVAGVQASGRTLEEIRSLTILVKRAYHLVQGLANCLPLVFEKWGAYCKWDTPILC